MKRKQIWMIVLLGSLVLSGCGQDTTISEQSVVETAGEMENTQEAEVLVEESKTALESEQEEISKNETEEEEKPLEITMYADFKNGCPSTFEPSGDWTNGSMFNVTWRKTSCTFEDEKLQLTIDYDPKGKDIPYSGAELRSKDFYGYGRYEVSMKAIKNDGVVSSFFTYTGPSDNNPWDEIDIEILGKDTTKVQFNYYTNSKGNHEKLVELGFDASEDFHTYAFEWRKNRIDWFVDGERVHTALTNIPKTEGRIMMNAWCGTGVDGWLKAFDDSNLPLTAEYQWISFAPIEE